MITKFSPVQLGAESDWGNLGNLVSLVFYALKDNHSLYRWGNGTSVVVPTLWGSECTLAVGDFTNTSSVIVSPNPFVDAVTIQYDLKENTRITVLITNTLGQIVSKKHAAGTIGNNQQTITMGNLPSGIYFISLQTDTDSAKIKIIKN